MCFGSWPKLTHGKQAPYCSGFNHGIGGRGGVVRSRAPMSLGSLLEPIWECLINPC